MTRLISITAFVMLLSASLIAQESKTVVTLAGEARSRLNSQDYDGALKAVKKLAETVDSERLNLFAGDMMLRCGASEDAIKQFDAHLKKVPDDRPYLWQLGIAYYFAGKSKEGADLFEIHREVNPNDVENAAWHFLCVAKDQSPKKAKELLLPAPGDPRPPMEEVLKMLADGDTQPVLEKMKSFTPKSSKEESAQFYGNLYLGLYADAMGDSKTALKHMKLAAENSPRNYMGDVAVVYAKFLDKPAKATETADAPQ